MFGNGALFPVWWWFRARTGGAPGHGTSLLKFINAPGGKISSTFTFPNARLGGARPTKWFLCTRGTALVNVTVHNIILRRPEWSAAPHHHAPFAQKTGGFGKVPGYLATARNTLTERRRPTELVIIIQLWSGRRPHSATVWFIVSTRLYIRLVQRAMDFPISGNGSGITIRLLLIIPT